MPCGRWLRQGETVVVLEDTNMNPAAGQVRAFFHSEIHRYNDHDGRESLREFWDRWRLPVMPALYNGETL